MDAERTDAKRDAGTRLQAAGVEEQFAAKAEEPSIKKTRSKAEDPDDLTAEQLLAQVASAEVASAKARQTEHTTDNDLAAVGTSFLLGSS